MVVLCIPGFTGLTREARRGDADGDERSHAEARGRTRRVLVGGVTRPSRLRALPFFRRISCHLACRKTHAKDAREILGDERSRWRRKNKAGRANREAVRGLRVSVPWSTRQERRDGVTVPV